MMATAERIVTFSEREFKGSRLRCLLLTNNAPSHVATFLNSLVRPHALVTVDDYWTPNGFAKPDEARLGETPGFLADADRVALTRWWLAHQGGANTPNWDLVSSCRINNRRGVILVEAKAHEAELSDDRCGATNAANSQRIESALTEANSALNALMIGFELSAHSHYQLSNRFAFAWKVAQFGTPVVLIYLGFLDANEMEGNGRVMLRDHAQWRRCLLSRSKRTVPENVWDKTFDVDGTPMTVLIRSAVVDVCARAASDAAAE